ncbi:MAG: aminotransferase class [Candidatus Eremiobacteraeota bacterium]|nr:aminotransferase class [Candidatus Eremiobacteraeota bacterium]
MHVVHGGDARAAARDLHLSLDALIDASANIAPEGPPGEVAAVLRALASDPAAFSRYPDPHYRELQAAAANHAGVGADRVVVANGSAALIASALRATNAARCILPVPSFSEYRKALATLEMPSLEVPLHPDDGFLPDVPALVERARTLAPACCVLANPNNPTGSALPAERMLDLVDRLQRVGVRTIVDEAFVDYAPSAALPLDRLPHGTVVLRSITKFHAIPGVRVGYAVSDSATTDAMSRMIPSWSVGAADAAIAQAVLTGSSCDERRTSNDRRREVLASLLRRAGLRVFPSVTNFLFCEAGARYHGTSGTLRADLLALEHVLVRSCDDYRGLPDGCFVRVAVLDDARNARVAEAFTNVMRPQRSGA